MSFHFLGTPDPQQPLGGKAEVLNELIQAEFPVPRGFVIFPETDLQKISLEDLEQAIQKIGGFPVAVRSSGTMEDLAGASFAGQYVTFLEVETAKDCHEKIQKCRDSVFSPQVQTYLEAKKIDPKKAEMCVLVQKMVPAKTAGVYFSIHPLTGREENSLIECCEGLGEKLVSGQISPNRYVVQSRTSVIESEEIAPDSVANSRLSAKNIRELNTFGLRLQAHYGYPQDIEWAIDAHDQLWILQSRPITQIRWRDDVEEYTNSDFKDGGVSARVCSPFMYSLYRDAFQESMPRYMKSLGLISKNTQDTYIRCFYGRPYWNASAIKRALEKIPGFDEKDFDQSLGIQKDYGPDGPIRIPTNPKTILPAIPVAISLQKNYQKQIRLAQSYAPGFLKKETAYLKQIPEFKNLTDAEFFKLLDEILDFHQQTECDYFTTIYNNSNFQDDFRKTVKSISKATGREISPIQLMTGLSDISHMEIQKGLLKLFRVAKENSFESSDWSKASNEFIQNHYFHGDAELDITVPRWGETPQRIQAIVAEMLASGEQPRDPEVTIQSQNHAFEKERSEILKAMDRKAFTRLLRKNSFLKQLETSRIFLVLRESMREFSTRSYHLVRLYALEAGNRWKKSGILSDPTDIFMVCTEDVRDWMTQKKSPSQIQEIVQHSKLMYLGYKNLTPPDELGGSVRQRSALSYVEESQDGKTILRGTGCSPGTIEGIVRIISELSETHQIQKGEILVTRFTDPGWTPVLGLVSGVITEVGGLLSHAAVIGREYGIPAVLNLQGATQTLKTGQRVKMNGLTGIVEIIE